MYIDDIVVFAKAFDEHLVKLRNVFKHLEEAGLVLQPPKCEFLLDEILYLGHVVGRDGHKPDERKIASVKNFPTPLCLTDVRSFLGLCSYYRKFIPNFAITAKPLTDLTKKETSFNWQKEQQEAFEELKRKLISYPVLAHYDTSRETQIRTDACAYGIGAILLQKIDEDWHPIAYMSRLLKKSQLNYHISDKECYAIVEAINKWRAYLDGIRFEVMTDHCSLCYLVTKKDLSPRLMRYSMALQRFDFRIVYKSGKHHHDVDALSRYPLVNEDELEKEESEEEEDPDDALCMAIMLEENELLNQQRADPILSSIIQKLQNLGSLTSKKRKSLSKYRLHEGILYRLIRRAFEEQFNIVVPSSMRKEICKAYHDDILSGHASTERTYQKIMSKYYWDGVLHRAIRHLL